MKRPGIRSADAGALDVWLLETTSAVSVSGAAVVAADSDSRPASEVLAASAARVKPHAVARRACQESGSSLCSSHTSVSCGIGWTLCPTIVSTLPPATRESRLIALLLSLQRESSPAPRWDTLHIGCG